jgi:hypothetical protein
LAERARQEGGTLVLEVPEMATPIRYTLADGTLTRNGPPIDAQVRLIENTSAESAPVVRGVTYTSGNADGAQCRVRSITG